MRRERHSNEKGYVLLITVSIMVVTLVLVFQLKYSAQMELFISKNLKADSQMSLASQSMIPIAMEKLKRDDSPAVDSFNDAWGKALHGLTMGEVTVTLRIVDEDGKFNVNSLIKQEKESNNEIEKRKDAFLRLLEALNIVWDDYQDLHDGKELMEKIIDYIDEDENGSFENEKINSNRPFLSLTELLNLPGVTPQFLFGETDPFADIEDVVKEERDLTWEEIRDKRREKLEDQRIAREEGDEEEFVFDGLANYITVMPTEGININTAPKQVLMCMSETITAEFADAILTYRESLEDDETGNTPTAPGKKNDDPLAAEKTRTKEFKSLADLRKIEFDKSTVEKFLQEAGVPPEKDPNDPGTGAPGAGDPPTGKPSDPKTDPAPAEKIKNYLKPKVNSGYFRLQTKAATPDGSLIYNGVFLRNSRDINLLYWERSASIPRKIQTTETE